MSDDLAQARLLLGTLVDTPPEQRWQLPFPVAVFGTLRRGFANHSRMRADPGSGRCAFLPHFLARQLALSWQRGASAPFEAYTYEAEEWSKVIRDLDELEDFRPGHDHPSDYHRTLAWLYLLPVDFQHLAYSLPLAQERNLQIDERSWASYERVPCWIYSNLVENRRAASWEDSPLIWDGVVYR
jgi:gamma-glutamylcyclotransferase (GGCT)/AIG2-like uncharacterized protein YtfP